MQWLQKMDLFLMVHNEGNISLITMMDTHIILAGIDKIVPTLEDECVSG